MIASHLHAGILGSVVLLPEGALQIDPLPGSLNSGLRSPAGRVPVLHPDIKPYASTLELNIGVGPGSPEGQEAFLDLLKACQ